MIPNLVETVKGYAAHERETLEVVTKPASRRSRPQGVENQAQAENMLTQALRQLFAVAEAYPDLKANQNFLALQEELTGTEGRIAFSRQFYNEQVLAYDNALETFPTNLVAGTVQLRAASLTSRPKSNRGQPVRVDFGQGGAPAPRRPPPERPAPPTGRPTSSAPPA